MVATSAGVAPPADKARSASHSAPMVRTSRSVFALALAMRFTAQGAPDAVRPSKTTLDAPRPSSRPSVVPPTKPSASATGAPGARSAPRPSASTTARLQSSSVWHSLRASYLRA